MEENEQPIPLNTTRPIKAAKAKGRKQI